MIRQWLQRRRQRRIEAYAEQRAVRRRQRKNAELMQDVHIERIENNLRRRHNETAKTEDILPYRNDASMALCASACAVLEELKEGPQGPVGLPGALGPAGDGGMHVTGRQAVLLHIQAIASTYKAGEIDKAYYDWYVARAMEWLELNHMNRNKPLFRDNVYEFIYREGFGPPPQGA